MYSKSGGWVLNSLFVDQPVTWTAAYNQTISSWFESVFCINANYSYFDILCFELIILDVGFLFIDQSVAWNRYCNCRRNNLFPIRVPQNYIGLSQQIRHPNLNKWVTLPYFDLIIGRIRRLTYGAGQTKLSRPGNQSCPRSCSGSQVRHYVFNT